MLRNEAGRCHTWCCIYLKHPYLSFLRNDIVDTDNTIAVQDVIDMTGYLTNTTGNILREAGRSNLLDLSIVFISHDMQVVRALSDLVLVMYFGKIVERGDAKTVLTAPQHEYTKTLLAAVPTIKR